MHRVTEFKLRDIDLYELRQIGRQAADLQFGNNVVNDAATQFDAWRQLSVDEVQRHSHVNLLFGINTLKIDVQDLPLPGMHLYVAQQNILLRAVNIHRQN